MHNFFWCLINTDYIPHNFFCNGRVFTFGHGLPLFLCAKCVEFHVITSGYFKNVSNVLKNAKWQKIKKLFGNLLLVQLKNANLLLVQTYGLNVELFFFSSDGQNIKTLKRC